MADVINDLIAKSEQLRTQDPDYFGELRLDEQVILIGLLERAVKVITDLRVHESTLESRLSAGKPQDRYRVIQSGREAVYAFCETCGRGINPHPTSRLVELFDEIATHERVEHPR